MRTRLYPSEDASSINSVENAAAAYLYLLSDDSQSIAGQRLTLDGDQLYV